MISQNLVNWIFNNQIYKNKTFLSVTIFIAIIGAFFAGYFLNQIKQTSETVTAAKPLQDKIVTKYAKIDGGVTHTTTALSTAPEDMPGASVSFSADEIDKPAKLVINWAARAFNASGAGSGFGVNTLVLVDGGGAAGTHISQPASGDTWTQHAANAVVSVGPGAHTVKVVWNVFVAGQTGVVADRHLTVMAIPQ